VTGTIASYSPVGVVCEPAVVCAATDWLRCGGSVLLGALLSFGPSSSSSSAAGAGVGAGSGASSRTGSGLFRGGSGSGLARVDECSSEEEQDEDEETVVSGGERGRGGSRACGISGGGGDESGTARLQSDNKRRMLVRMVSETAAAASMGGLVRSGSGGRAARVPGRIKAVAGAGSLDALCAAGGLAAVRIGAEVGPRTSCFLTSPFPFSSSTASNTWGDLCYHLSACPLLSSTASRYIHGITAVGAACSYTFLTCPLFIISAQLHPSPGPRAITCPLFSSTASRHSCVSRGCSCGCRASHGHPFPPQRTALTSLVVVNGKLYLKMLLLSMHGSELLDPSARG